MSRLDDFREDCFRAHNEKRLLHGVCALRHSLALDKTAQDWAEALLSEDGIKNSPLSSRGEVGESISVRTSTGTHVDMQGHEVVNTWHSDAENYNYENGKGPAGNFTQLVWSSTREVGFGKACGPGKCVVVAHYRPPGNVLGRYLENVFRPKKSVKDVKQPIRNTFALNNDTPKTVITETLTESDGKQYSVRREISDLTDDKGKNKKLYLVGQGKKVEYFSCCFNNRTRRCINEVYTDACKEQKKAKSSISPDGHLVDNSKKLQESIHSVVQLHNQYRSQHGSNPLVLDQNLSNMAQQWADHLLQQSHLSNSGYVYRGMKVGENLGSRWSNGPMELNCKDLIEHWYQESGKYKFNSEPDSIQGIGNFTQIVWTSSERIGVGIAIQSYKSGEDLHKDSKMILVCLYHPPGNVISQFQNNVKKAIK
uniref:Venom allergen-like protein 11 n=1 Tax=Schistosoma mansoni TaxID=6183 RepID=Q1WL54_SCHMA|nr:venom allergen-like protein 11 [Schistosoma mansoni]